MATITEPTAATRAVALRPGADPLSVLRNVWGYPDFRGRQREAIDQILSGGDALVLMPTGGGKSLCYQVPALCLAGTTIVVSPLIALMQDQVSALRQLGVRAAFLNSTLDRDTARTIWRDLQAGAIDLLYVAPERLVMDGFLDALQRVRIALFAVDEAHCISQWGHDFREHYLMLSVLAERFPHVPRLALTATADDRTRADIVKRLHLEQAPVFSSSFDRPNIDYSILLKNEPKKQLLGFLRKHRGEAGIVYCLSRNSVDATAEMLRKEGVDAIPYHAGLAAPVRERNQDRFLKEEGVVVVATVAFGMGIDKPNVRWVFHMDLPGSVEAYYQETGRAGRDGLPAEVCMVYGMGDAAQRRRMIDDNNSAANVKQVEHAKLTALLGLCEAARCRRQVLLSYFGEHMAEPCGKCDVCRDPVETWDGTEAARKALSAVFRTGQSFGVGHLVDVLMGNKTEKVEAKGHHKLQTFGIGQDLSRHEWQSVFRQLLAANRVSVDHAAHGGLRLTEDARPLLRGEETMLLRRDPSDAVTRALKSKFRGKGATPAGSSAPSSLDATGQTVFEALRKLRLDIARAQGNPPYIIFNDNTLLEMAERLPRDLGAMARVSGVGDHKLDRYGADFVKAINDTLAARGC